MLTVARSNERSIHFFDYHFDSIRIDITFELVTWCPTLKALSPPLSARSEGVCGQCASRDDWLLMEIRTSETSLLRYNAHTYISFAIPRR